MPCLWDSCRLPSGLPAARIATGIPSGGDAGYPDGDPPPRSERSNVKQIDDCRDAELGCKNSQDGISRLMYNACRLRSNADEVAADGY